MAVTLYLPLQHPKSLHRFALVSVRVLCYERVLSVQCPTLSESCVIGFLVQPSQRIITAIMKMFSISLNLDGWKTLFTNISAKIWKGNNRAGTSGSGGGDDNDDEEDDNGGGASHRHANVSEDDLRIDLHVHPVNGFRTWISRRQSKYTYIKICLDKKAQWHPATLP